MATVADLLVRIGGDVSELQRALQQGRADLGQFESAELGAAVAAGALGTALAVAGAAIAAFLALSVKSAADARKEYQLLENAIRGSGQAFDITVLTAQATAMQTLIGINDEAVISMQRLLIQYGANQDQVTQLIPRILDFAAATGRDAQESTLIFARGLTGMDMALRRVLGKMGEGINLTDNFAGTMELLDKRFAGTAETAGRSLFGSLDRLKNSIQDVLEIVGSPLLTPLIRIITVMGDGAIAVRDLAQAFPLVAEAGTVFLAVLSLMLLGAGGLLAYTLVIPKVIALLESLAIVVGVDTAAFTAMSGGSIAAAAALNIFGLAVKASLIGLLITGIVLAIAHWRELVAAINAGAQFIATLFVEVGSGIGKILAGNFKEGVDQIRGSLQKAGKEGANTFRDTLSLLESQEDKTQKATEELRQSVDELNKAFAKTAAAAKLFSSQQQLFAAQQARTKLAQPGLNIQDITAIEEARQRAVAEATQTELQIRISGKREEIANIKKLGKDGDTALLKAQQELLDDENALEQSRIDVAKQTANAIVQQQKVLAEERIRIAQASIQQQLEAEKGTIETAKDVEQARAQVAEEGRNRRLEILRLEEETRVGMLKRMVDIERQIGQDLISARESLAGARRISGEAEEVRAAARRADLLQKGFLDERTFDEQQANARRTRLLAELNERQRIEELKVQIARQGIQAGIAIAQSEAQSRLLILKQEVEVRKANLKAQAQLRIQDLAVAANVARLETQAKIAEMQAQLQARKAELIAELRAREAAGQITPEERQAREGALRAIDEGFLQSTAALSEGVRQRQMA